MTPDRELNAFLAGGEHARTTEPTEMQVDAAAKAMYKTRPKHTDPAWWETPWGELPAQWQAGQKAAARRVLEAARDAGKDTDQ